MGRQVLFHAFADDLQEFLGFACDRNAVTVVLKDSDGPDLTPLQDPAHEIREMMLWNQELLPGLHRELVKRPPRGDYYRIPYSLPVLELSPSIPVLWDEQPGLLRGRLYGCDFDNGADGYLHWYNRLSGWIRRHFTRNPIPPLYGYIGPNALTWFNRGGLLLPWPAPPVTPQWKSVVDAQQHLRMTDPNELT
jgi:hypothetical protein